MKTPVKARIFQKRTRIPAPVEKVFSWHTRPGAIERLSPPWAPVRLVHHSSGPGGGIVPGVEAVLEISRLGPFSLLWKARHTDLVENEFFRDIQESGPFSKWVHTHRFEPDGPDACILNDEIEYALPFHPASTALAGGLADNRLDRIFTYRHNTTSGDIIDHLKGGLDPLNILITGSHGVIGTALVPFLTTGGHNVTRLVRQIPPPGTDSRFWDPAAGKIDLSGIGRIDAVIHLAGENIGQGKWDRRKKQRIIESRSKSTALLAETLAGLKSPPRVLISASAIGYYGNRGDRILSEADDPGEDFISGVCKAWEDAAAPAADAGIRTVLMRIGVVLTPMGGALQRLLPVFRMGLGGRIGTGSQYVSWIGIDDVLGAVLHAIADDSIQGPVNLVSPNPATNAELARTLGKVLSRPAALPVPEIAIKTAFGQMGRETILSSTRVYPEKLVKSGYEFRHTDLEPALAHVLGRARQTITPGR